MVHVREDTTGGGRRLAGGKWSRVDSWLRSASALIKFMHGILYYACSYCQK